MTRGPRVCAWLAVPAAVLACAASLLFALPALSAPEIPAVYATLPWITNMAGFIVGSTMKVQPLSSWNESGALRTLRRVPQDAAVIALDPEDARRYGLKPDRGNLHMLYKNLPVPEGRRNSLQFDPSMLPFLSQRMLIVLSRLQPENYPFYQRRLAEFQSRLESTLEVGRIQIRGLRMLDLTGAVSPWIKAAAADAVRPPEDLWAAWSKGDRASELALAIDEANRRGWWTVIDAWTPQRIRLQAAPIKNKIFINSPEIDQDFFVYLHDIYLQMWSSTVRK